MFHLREVTGRNSLRLPHDDPGRVRVKRVIHVLTPGDHFSPLTGSAIPTVVHGLATAAARDADPVRHAVVVDGSTMRPRYNSAEAIEYERGPWLSRNDRALDQLRARLGGSRTATRRFYAPVADAIRRCDPSIVLAHNAPVLPHLLRDTPHRVVLYAHNDVLRSYSRAEAQRALDGVAAIVTVGEALAQRTRAALPPYLAERVRVVGNGVDCEMFSPAQDGQGVAIAAVQESAARMRSARLRVVFLGRMIEEKGPDVLIRAVGLLRRPDLEVLLIGSQGFARDAPLSPFEHELRRLADQTMTVTGSGIRFEPFVDRLALSDLLRSADVLVVPSRWDEPSGLTAAEGLASGLPVIASRVGGLPDVVGSAGILVAPDDPTALAGALAALADDPEARLARARMAREHALEHDWSWAWSNLRRVLEEL